MHNVSRAQFPRQSQLAAQPGALCDPRVNALRQVQMLRYARQVTAGGAHAERLTGCVKLVGVERGDPEGEGGETGSAAA